MNETDELRDYVMKFPLPLRQEYWDRFDRINNEIRLINIRLGLV